MPGPEKDLAFHLRFFDDVLLDRAFVAASNYGVQVKPALDRTIEVIHGLPRLHGATSREQLEVYIGRCGQNRLEARFNEHARRFDHGVVLFTTHTEDIARFETIGIALVQELKDEGALCVNNCNIKGDGYGTVAADAFSAVYLVWKRTTKPYAFERPTIAAIRRVTERVVDRLGGMVTRRQVIEALRKTKQLSTGARLRWAPIP